MNYDIYLDRTDPIFISTFEDSEEFRPRLGDQITFPNDLRVYKITRVSPSDNPDDKKVTYYVTEYVENMFSQADIITDNSF